MPLDPRHPDEDPIPGADEPVRPPEPKGSSHAIPTRAPYTHNMTLFVAGAVLLSLLSVTAAYNARGSRAAEMVRQVLLLDGPASQGGGNDFGAASRNRDEGILP